jgi:glutamate synthase domain-containing protein 3
MVELEPLVEPENCELVRDLLIQHAGYTGSTVAARLLNDWEWALGRFVKVMPIDYRRVLEQQRSASRNGVAHARDRLEEVEVTRG